MLHFLNRLSNAVRASFGLRITGVGTLAPAAAEEPTRTRRAVTRDCYARVEELALVHLVLVGNARRDRLRALETRRWFEKGALLTAVESSAAFWTRAFKVDVRGQSDRAVVTTGSCHGLNKPGKTRAGRILHRTRTCWPRRLLSFFPFVVGRTVGVHIAVLPVFAIRIHNYGCISLVVTTLADAITWEEGQGRQECLPITPTPIL